MMRAMIVLALLAAVARADRMAPPAVPERVARTDVTVVAKVKRIEDKTVELPAWPGVKFKVAVLEVKEKVAGKVAATTLKLAFVPPAGPRFRDPHLNFKAGTEMLFFLKKAHGSDYYRVMMYYDAEAATPPILTQAREAGKLLANPRKGLDSKNAAERALTAGLLIVRYRSQPLADPKKIKQMPISPVESRLILQALAEGNWKTPAYLEFSPRSLFIRLGLTEKDGWKVKNFAAVDVEAKAWLKANAGKYIIKRFTAGGVAVGP
jgi:hypothetical protein